MNTANRAEIVPDKDHDLSEQLEYDVRSYFCQLFGDEYGVCFPEELILEVVEEVKQVSAYSEGHYNDTDLQWAVARELLYRLGVSV